MTVAKQTRVWLFLAMALSINIIDPQLARAIPKPAVGIGAALDMAVLVPALYFWLVVRSGLQPLATMVPLCLLALFRATWVVPGLSIARPVAAVAASEIAVVYYAFASWRRKPEVPLGMRAYSIHQRSGAASLFGALAGISLVEVPLLHLLVMRWSITAAWILSALGAYGAIWLAGMARALALRPVLVGNGELVLRCGILWTLRVPLDRVASIHQSGGASDLQLCPGGDPNLTMEFSEPVIATGIFGIRRPVTRVALSLDEPAAFERCLVRLSSLPH
jgi:hypothetical protein